MGKLLYLFLIYFKNVYLDHLPIIILVSRETSTKCKVIAPPALKVWAPISYITPL